MPKYLITLGQTVEEYKSVYIVAESAKAAEAEVQRLIDGEDSQTNAEYCDLINNGSTWEMGDTHDTRICEVQRIVEERQS